MKANRLAWVFLLVLLGNRCSQQSASAGATNVTAAATNIASQPVASIPDSSPDVVKGETIEAIRAKAEKGDAQAQCNLGLCYAEGKGGPTNHVEAVKWFRKAAEQNFPPAQYNLGGCYAEGQGVARDMVEAVKWLRKAAEQNDAKAQFSLGVRYANGQGVAKDEAEAYKWVILALAQDNESAKENKTGLEDRMSREQIAEGKRRANDWLEQRKKEHAGQR